MCCSEIIEEGHFCEGCLSRFIIEHPATTKLDNMQVYCCFHYAGGMKRAINRFKFYNFQHYGAGLASQMITTLSTCKDQSFGAVVYVPMPAERERLRGYNQAKILAAQLAKQLDLPYNNGGMAKVTTFSQHDFNKSLRQKFTLDGLKKEEDIVLPDHVLLVDDIYSTGSTLKTCQKMLKEAGVKKITAIVLAKS